MHMKTSQGLDYTLNSLPGTAPRIAETWTNFYAYSRHSYVALSIEVNRLLWDCYPDSCIPMLPAMSLGVDHRSEGHERCR